MGLGNSARKRDGTEINYLMPNRENGTSIDVGLSSVFGTVTTIAPQDDYRSLLPIKISATVASIAAETVTVRFTATYEDGTTQNVDKTLAADGVIELDAEDYADLYTSEKNIKSIGVSAHTSDGASGPTVALDSLMFDYP